MQTSSQRTTSITSTMWHKKGVFYLFLIGLWTGCFGLPTLQAQNKKKESAKTETEKPEKKAKDEKFGLKTIVIDAGHGGKDPGTSGKKHQEKDIALAVALEVGRLMKQHLPEVKVIYTRDKDEFIELHERAGIANRNHADLFISIHCNAGIPAAIGSETYVMGLNKSKGNLDVAKRENAVIAQEDNFAEKYGGFNPKSPLAHIFFANYQNAHLTNSLKLAEKIEDHMKTKTLRKSRGVRQDGFLVLWRTAMPSVLVEIGYLSNPKDEKFLASEQGQTQIAASIYRAVRDYKMEVEGKPSKPKK